MTTLGFVRNKPRKDLSMGTAKQVIPTENKGFQGPAGVPQRNGLVQIEPRIDLSMGTEILEIP